MIKFRRHEFLSESLFPSVSQSHCQSICYLLQVFLPRSLSVLPLEAAGRVFVRLLHDHHRRRPVVRRRRRLGRLVRGRGARHGRRLRARPCGGAIGRRAGGDPGAGGLLLAQLPTALLYPQFVAVLIPRQIRGRHSRCVEWDNKTYM